MNILIEFQDCSLEIGHIGTRIELFMDAVTEMATQILEGLHKIFDPLIKVISDLWDRFPTEMKKLAEEEGGRGRSMTDTTITALLEELREVDPETMTAINFYSKGLQGFDIDTNPNKLVKEDIIQGCIQRAIAAKPGWYYCILKFSENDDRYHAIVEPPLKPQCQYDADTPAAAILAAYIEAVRARQ